ncbi:hypothetical protein [Embleya sp. NPDC005575]|uniref:SCO7613 C-terminal domain-containing membrane protein n=1 Tax=Embleya sp. NPDC005575 TaxID=3156892 RepID=UPI0033A38BA8
MWAALGRHPVVAAGWGCAWRVRPLLPLVGLAHGVSALVWATAHPLTSIVVWAIVAGGLTITAVLSPGRPAPEPSPATAPEHTVAADDHVSAQDTANLSDPIQATTPPTRQAGTAPSSPSESTPSPTSTPDVPNASAHPPHDADADNPYAAPAARAVGDGPTDQPEQHTPLPARHLIRPLAAAFADALGGVDAAMTAAHAGASTVPVPGAAVPATVGLVHLLPHLAPVYDAVPRWAVLGTAGLLLIVIGAGYERRLRDLKRLRRAVGRLGWDRTGTPRAEAAATTRSIGTTRAVRATRATAGPRRGRPKARRADTDPPPYQLTAHLR